jgi:hypothetical protein
MASNGFDAAGMAIAAAGLVVARRQPRNPIGWLLLGCVIVVGLGGIAARYAVLDYRLDHHGRISPGPYK